MKSISPFILFLLIFSLHLNSQTNNSTGTYDERGFSVKIGDEAPDFEMNFLDGTFTRLKDLRGKVVVLQFTASWCSVCRKEAPHLENEVWLPNKDKDFVLIGIDRDEPLEKVRAFVDKLGTTYPMSLDPGAGIFTLFANPKSGVTRNIVIDKEGKIVFLTRLFSKPEFETMKKKIEELLNQE